MWGFMRACVLVQVDTGGAGDLSVSGHEGVYFRLTGWVLVEILLEFIFIFCFFINFYFSNLRL